VLGPDEGFQPGLGIGVVQVDGVLVDAQAGSDPRERPEGEAVCPVAAHLRGDDHRRRGVPGVVLGVETVVVAVEEEVEASAGADFDQRQGSRPVLLEVIDVQAEGDAAAYLVGLGGPLSQQLSQFLAVVVAEGAECGQEVVIRRAVTPVGWVVGGQRVAGQEQVDGGEEQGGSALIGRCVCEQVEQIPVGGDALAERLVDRRASTALGSGEEPEQSSEPVRLGPLSLGHARSLRPWRNPHRRVVVATARW
jgi:hypothetical protein